MKNYFHWLLIVFFCGILTSSYSQQPIFIGKVKDVAFTYKKKALAAANNMAEAEVQVSHSLLTNKLLILKLKSGKKEGFADVFFGEVYNTQFSNFYMKIAGPEVSGSIVMRKEKKFFRYSSTPDGSVYLTEENIDKVLCVGFNEAPKTTTASTSQTTAVAAAPPLLESLPGAGAVLYLDFDGQTVTNTLWNSNFNAGNAIVASPANLSEFEMAEVWKLVSEDYRPFGLNVTTSETIFNSAPIDRRMRVIFTSTNYFYPNAGGVAYVGSFTWGISRGAEHPCWVFNASIKGAGEAGSHEGGHTLSLVHDGRTSPVEEYFQGQGSWAPIMGVGYYVPVVQWSKGEYPFANNLENDLSKISTLNGFGYRADDHGNSITSATPLIKESNGDILAANNKGVISTQTDVDVFSYTTGGGNISFNVQPDPDYPNLDILLTLRNSANTIIATNDPSTQNASIGLSLAAGTYYLTIDGTRGALGANSDYGSLGSYSISSISTSLYCVPLYTTGCSSSDYIENFSFNMLVNNNSGCSNGTATGYTNYAPAGTLTTSVNRGQSYSMNMQSGPTYSQGFGVWIDYNNDKDFTDAGEFVYASPFAATSLFTTSITVPATATLGSTRMRIRCRYSNIITSTESCNALDWGEAEDYTITILNTLPAITTFLPVNGPAGTGVMIKGTNFTTVSAVLINSIPATTIYTASSTLLYATVPSGATTGKIQVQAQGGSVTSSGTFTVAAISSKWVPKAGLATPRVQHGTIATNGKIYVFGGRSSSSSHLKVLAIYNPSTNTYVSGAAMPVATRGMAVALGSNGSIYMFGGVTAIARVASTYRYTPSTNSWTAMASMPAAVFEAAAAATSNGKIYVFGGEPSTAKTTSTNATRIYNIATNTWSSGANMPVGVQQHSAITGNDGKIYVIGGRAFSANEPLGLVQIYNPTTNTWSTGAAMPIPKVQFGATIAADGRIYVIGGKAAEPNSTGPYFHTVEIYNPSTNSWSTGQVIPVALGQQTAVNLNDNLYAISGSDNTIRNYNFQLIMAPVAPTTLTATAVSSSQINLSWTDKAKNETGYTVERATASGGPFTSIASLGANITTYSNTGRSPGVTYYYRVKGTNTAGSSSYSNVASATTVAPVTIAVVSGNAVLEEKKSNDLSLSVLPNPVRINAKISFSVDEDQHAMLEIYDVHGRLIKKLYNGFVQKNKLFQFQWNVTSHVAGIYFSRLTTRKKILSQKIVVLQ